MVNKKNINDFTTPKYTCTKAQPAHDVDLTCCELLHQDLTVHLKMWEHTTAAQPAS